MGERVHEHAEAIEYALRALLDLHPDALVAAVGDDGLFVELPASLGITGHPVVRGRSGLDLVDLDDQVFVIEAWERTRRDGAARLVVELPERPDAACAMHFFDTSERHGAAVLVVVTDDPEHLLLRAAAPSNLPPRVARVRKDSIAVICEIDEATTQLLGWPPEEIVGVRSLDFVHPDDQALAIERWMEMLTRTGNGRVRLRHRHRDGGWVWLEITNDNRLDVPGEECVLAEMVDISHEMEAMETLRAREQLLARLAETLPLGVFQVFVDRRVAYANERLHAILGVASVSTVGDVVKAVHPADRRLVEDAVTGVLEGIDGNVEVGVRDGARRCELTVRPLIDDDGRVNGAVACLTDVTERVRLQGELEFRASHDPLTGCLNRRALTEALDAVIARGDVPVALVYADLDGFKSINDELGHGVGDAVLRIVADRLRMASRTDDLVGRLGGDEFVVVAQGVVDGESAARLAERMTRALNSDVMVSGRSVALRASIGIALPAPGNRTGESLLHEADEAMYESKRENAHRAVLRWEGADAVN